MEKFADEIERLLQEKLSLYDSIYNLLIEEKACVAEVDIDSLWDTTAQKKAYVYRVELLRYQIVDTLSKKYPGLQIKPDSFSLSKLIQYLKVPPEKLSQFKQLIIAINTIKDDISRQALENSKFINENLSIINGIFSTIMDSKEKEEEYNHSGNVRKHDSNKRLLNMKV